MDETSKSGISENEPSDPSPSHTGPVGSLDRCLEGMPHEVRAKVLQLVLDSGITNKDDLLYQIVQALGIYGAYFETIPTKIGDNIEEKISRLEIIATQIQRTSGDDYEGLKEEGSALISALQEFVILTQSVKTETHLALERTSNQLKELSEAFSKEIKERIVEKTLEELLVKTESTIKSSKAMLEGAMAVNQRAAEEIAKTSEEVLVQSRTQLAQTHEFNSESARRKWSLVFLGGLAVSVAVIAASFWVLFQTTYERRLDTARSEWESTAQQRWEDRAEKMGPNRAILEKLSENGVQLRFVRNKDATFLVVPGSSGGETENGVYIKVGIGE